MARNAHMNLRVRPALKAKLEKLAKEDRRTLSAYVEKLLEDHVDQLRRRARASASQTGLIAPLLDLVEVAPVGPNAGDD